MTKKKRNVFSLNIQQNLLLGAFILFPLWITLYFAYIIFILIARFTYPLIEYLPIHDNQAVMYIISFFLSLLVIYLIGVLTNMWLGRSVLNIINNTIRNIPIIGSFYKSLMQLVDTFNNADKKSEQKVVLINFPSADMKTIGFLIKTIQDSKTKQMLATVFVPTTPNPTSGYLEIVPMDKITPLDWTFEEAMAFIISGGASMPDKEISLSTN